MKLPESNRAILHGHSAKAGFVFSLLAQAIYMTLTLSALSAAPVPFNTVLNEIADKIAASARESGKNILAVSDLLELSGETSQTGTLVAEELITILNAKSGIKVVERRLLHKVMEEHGLALSAMLERSTVKRLGALLGADAVCTGTVAELGPAVRVNARLIDVETGVVISAASADMDKAGAPAQLSTIRPANIERHNLKHQPGSPSGSTRSPSYRGNLIVNGDFRDGLSGWERRIGDLKQGASKAAVIDLDATESGRALRIEHHGNGHVQFHQSVRVPGPDLLFVASFQAETWEGRLKGFSGTGVVQIGIEYLDKQSRSLGRTVILSYVRNPFADLPLPGVPRREPDSYICHYIEVESGKFFKDYKINLKDEIEQNLLGIKSELVKEIAIAIWCGANHNQAGAILWVADVMLASLNSR